jgi:hypothetical protein
MRLDEIQDRIDMNLTDFDMNELPSPLSLFVKKKLPDIFSQKTKFLAIPTRAKDGQFKRKDGITYLYDLCVQYCLPKSGKQTDLEKRLLVFFFKYPDVFRKKPSFQSEYDSNLWTKFNYIDKAEKEAAEIIRNQDPMPEMTVLKSDFRPSLLNVFHLMRQAGGLEQDLNIDLDGAFSYNGLRYECQAVQNELAEVNIADLVDFDAVGCETPQQPQLLRRRTQECLLRLLTIIFVDDEVFRRFVVEGKETPPRLNLDEGETGGNANIPQELHR